MQKNTSAKARLRLAYVLTFLSLAATLAVVIVRIRVPGASEAMGDNMYYLQVIGSAITAVYTIFFKERFTDSTYAFMQYALSIIFVGLGIALVVIGL